MDLYQAPTVLITEPSIVSLIRKVCLRKKYVNQVFILLGLNKFIIAK